MKVSDSVTSNLAGFAIAGKVVESHALVGVLHLAIGVFDDRDIARYGSWGIGSIIDWPR
ncbi:MAG TPA: hypothetical protein VLE74_00710 [Candidatus Saccharimonadales bacterium]|nr:hypothetical protein [Candidatus Saccharimonadales bacterium]